MIREEATLEEWNKLFEITLNIKGLQPWEKLWDMDIITIQIPNYKEPFFCSIMGKAGHCMGISVYEGYDSLNDFYRMSNNKSVPNHQIIRYYNCMTCYFGSRDELTSKELKLIKELGYKFRGKNNWLSFQSIEPKYIPYMLDKNEVIKLTEVFANLFMSLRSLNEGVKVDFESGNTLCRIYNENEKLWFNFEAPMMLAPTNYLKPTITDEIILAKLKKRPRNKTNLEVDIVNLNSTINDKSYKKPAAFRMYIIIDMEAGVVVANNVLKPSDNDLNIVINNLVEFIMNYGIPNTVYVRDEYMENYYKDLCSRLNIKLMVKGSLKFTDDFAEMYMEMNN